MADDACGLPVRSVQQLRVQPGDVIVLRHPPLCDAEREEVEKAAQGMVGATGATWLVMPEYLSVERLTPAQLVVALRALPAAARSRVITEATYAESK